MKKYEEECRQVLVKECTTEVEEKCEDEDKDRKETKCFPQPETLRKYHYHSSLMCRKNSWTNTNLIYNPCIVLKHLSKLTLCHLLVSNELF